MGGVVVQDKKGRKRLQNDFLSLVDPRTQLLDLFDHVPGAYVFLKDKSSRYMWINQVMCEVFGIDDPLAIVGKTDFDYFPPAVAAQYIEQDEAVLASKEPEFNRLWLVPDSRGTPHWYVSNKFVLNGADGNPVGVIGIKRKYEMLGGDESKHGRLLPVVDYVIKHFGDPIEVSQLAELADLSISQLQREFSRLFGVSPSQYVREVRVGVARHLLKTTDNRLSAIASHCGFCDQSHFSRIFKTVTGITPLQYRKRFIVS